MSVCRHWESIARSVMDIVYGITFFRWRPCLAFLREMLL